MAYKYSYKTRDIKFILNEWLQLKKSCPLTSLRLLQQEDFDTIIDQVHKVAAEVIAPTAEGGDEVESVMKMVRPIYPLRSMQFTASCRITDGNQQHRP